MRQRVDVAGNALKVHEREEALWVSKAVPVGRESNRVETFLIGADVVYYSKTFSLASAVGLFAVGGGVVRWDDSAECCYVADSGSSDEEGGDHGSGRVHGR